MRTDITGTNIKTQDLEIKQRTMSKHTKTKIRKKIVSWSQIQKKLYFITLTFLNAVEDEQAIILLRKFLDNAKKRKKGFQYLWVAERQKKNILFPDNIHFHLITNKSFEIKKYLKYWIDLQNKNNVIARNENFNPSSAFDIKAINATNIKRLTLYLTKYVTKNEDSFNCQVWNCSKEISRLYTVHYSYENFLDNFKRVTTVTEKIIENKDFKTTLFLVPLDKTTLRLYNKLDEKNLDVIKAINNENT